MSKRTRKVIYERLDTTNVGGGSVLVERSSIVKRVEVEMFVQLYVEDMSWCSCLVNITDYRILFYLLGEVYYGSDLVHIVLNKRNKGIIGDTLGISIRCVEKSIYNLVSCNVLIRIGRGVYAINPKLIYKGYYKDRGKVIDYVFDNRSNT
jgi:hypothetical protein